jgi:S1-C subfamily serine protease
MRPLYFATTAVVGLTLVALAPAQRPAPPAAMSGKDIFQKSLKSITWLVQVAEVKDGRVRFKTGSGSLIDVPRKLVLTNYHVVGEAKTISVLFPQFDKSKQLISDKEYYFNLLRGKTGHIEGEVIARSSKQDLAIVQLPVLPPGATAVRLAKDGLGPGDTVHSIGNPGASGALWVYTPGSVKTVYKRKIMTGTEDRQFQLNARIVETTSPVNPGDSGGPVFNSAGELAAVTQGHLSEEAARSISVFIDISEVRGLLADNKIRITESTRPEATTVADNRTEPKTAEATKAAAEAPDPAKQEKLAEQKLDFAKDLIKNRPTVARERLEEIVKIYPKTKAAAEAKELLKTLKK